MLLDTYEKNHPNTAHLLHLVRGLTQLRARVRFITGRVCRLAGRRSEHVAVIAGESTALA